MSDCLGRPVGCERSYPSFPRFSIYQPVPELPHAGHKIGQGGGRATLLFSCHSRTLSTAVSSTHPPDSIIPSGTISLLLLPNGGVANRLSIPQAPSSFCRVAAKLRPITMVFTSPSWVPKLPFDPPDSIPISEFMFDEHYGRYPLGYSKAPFTCGLTGKEYSALEVKERIDYLARALAKEFGWSPNTGSEWDKVVAVFSVNTVSALVSQGRGYL